MRLKTSELDFHLSGFEIPQHPRPLNQHKLLVYNKKSDSVQHTMFKDIEYQLKPGDLLVFNNSKVMSASVFLDAGKFILFIEPLLKTLTNVRVICPFKPKVGESFKLDEYVEIILKYHEPGWDVYHADIIDRSNKYKSLQQFLSDKAKIPMPIYLKRIPTNDDEKDLQNYYAKNTGSISTPVAGLHFDNNLVERLKEKGVHTAEITLHVGYGTFRSFKTEYVDEHKMDKEWYCIEADAMKEIVRAKKRGSKVIGVGTTGVRVLESLGRREDFWKLDEVNETLAGETDIFIYPPYEFKVVDGLITNFQFPRLPVLTMAAAFTGVERLKEIYEEAVDKKYKFYSFGDALLFID